MPGLEHMIGHAIVGGIRRVAAIFAVLGLWLAFAGAGVAVAFGVRSVPGFRPSSIPMLILVVVASGVVGGRHATPHLLRVLGRVRQTAR